MTNKLLDKWAQTQFKDFDPSMFPELRGLSYSNWADRQNEYISSTHIERLAEFVQQETAKEIFIFIDDLLSINQPKEVSFLILDGKSTTVHKECFCLTLKQLRDTIQKQFLSGSEAGELGVPSRESKHDFARAEERSGEIVNDEAKRSTGRGSPALQTDKNKKDERGQ